MRIIDENGIEVETPDLEKGYLKNDSLFIMHHEEIKAVEEVGHYEIVTEYPNGGKDAEWIVEVPGVEAKEAWDEYEEILRYVAYTEAELKIREYEKNRKPMSVMEVFEMLLPAHINKMDIADNTALRMIRFYPEWEPGMDCPVGFRVRRNDKLWRVRDGQAHSSLNGWEPENAPALWEQINETHSGTAEDPIPYDGNMALTNGLYYYQDGKMYLCNRETINPVYHALSDLIGIYVSLVL